MDYQRRHNYLVYQEVYAGSVLPFYIKNKRRGGLDYNKLLTCTYLINGLKRVVWITLER